MADLSVKLTVPEDVYKSFTTARLQLPAAAGDITILPERAPSEFLLKNGLLRLLDEQGQPQDGYFVKGGIAQVAGDECLVATEMVVPFDEITLEQALEQAENAELSQDEKMFYQAIADKLRLLKR